jgi:hypothetical protein
MYTARQFLEVIPESGGMLTVIAKRLGCSWHTVKAGIERYKTVKNAIDEERRRSLDLAQSVVLGNIKAAAKKQKSDDTKMVDSRDAKWLLSRLDPDFKDKAELVIDELFKPYVGISPDDWDSDDGETVP